MIKFDYIQCYNRRLYYIKKHNVSLSNIIRRREIELLALLNTNYQESYAGLYVDELLTRIKWKL